MFPLSSTAQPPNHGPSAPSRIEQAAPFAVPLLAAYTAVRAYWESGHSPGELSPTGDDLVIFTGWWSVALCAIATCTAFALAARPAHPLSRRVLLGTGLVTAVALIAAGALLLLDAVGLLFAGMGVGFFPAGALSRLVCVGSGLLVGAQVLSYSREVRGACMSCERGPNTVARLTITPAWAYWAAYAAVAGCGMRIVAQAAVGFDETPMSAGLAMWMFEGGFLLAGTVLPLSLVHAWGRIWPGWVPLLSGRRIPRWLVLGPTAVISVGMSVYFGLTLISMIANALRGEPPFPTEGSLDLPAVFFWVAIPAYCVWAWGMAAAAVAYFLRTRPTCRTCHR